MNRKWFAVRSAAVFLAPILGIFLILLSLEPVLSTDSSAYRQTDFYRSNEMKSAVYNISRSLSEHIEDSGSRIGIQDTLPIYEPHLYYCRSDANYSFIQTNTGKKNLGTLYAYKEEYADRNALVIWYDEGEIQVFLHSADVSAELGKAFRELIADAFTVSELDPLAVQLMLALGSEDAPDSTWEKASLVERYYREWCSQQLFASTSIAALILGAALVIVGIIFRKYRKNSVVWLLNVLRRIPLEAKIVLALPLGILGVYMLRIRSHAVGRFYLPLPDRSSAVSFLCFVVLWYLLLDFIRTKKPDYVKNSIVWKLIRAVRRLIQRLIVRTPLERRHLTRFGLFAAAELGTMLFTVFFLILALTNYLALTRILSFFLALLGFAAILFFIIRYALLLKTDCEDLQRLSQLTASLRKNTLTHIEPFSETHDFYPLADDLIHLQEGLSEAIEARVKSERMKTELITNVSHDLKTPLTSIISYSQLLDEQNLPEPAGGYVKILCRKAERLQRLTGDLFEVSKAQSGNLPVKLTRLDLKAHLEQTLAELSERIDRSGLTFRVRLPENEVWIDADGQKLYRVLENLITNILNYAMSGTRVYITLSERDGEAEISLRNVSAEEMSFTAEQIVERFVRGDAARTQDETAPAGSGLGLAIAKSFTEAIGGTFSLSVDGDIFSVFLGFSVQDEPEG